MMTKRWLDLSAAEIAAKSAANLAARKTPAKRKAETPAGVPAKPPSTKGHAMFALGRLKRGQMNKTEAAYAQHLTAMQITGEVIWWIFEGMKLRLADNTFYSPDFIVMASDRVIECHEVKGFWMDDARVKIKVAAEIHPFRFVAIKAEAKKRGGGWKKECFGEDDET